MQNLKTDCHLLKAHATSLEDIIEGAQQGAGGTQVSFALTADGVAVLAQGGKVQNPKGEWFDAKELDYLTLRQHCPKVVTVGQVIETAKSCGQILGITLANGAGIQQIALALSHADYTASTLFIVGSLTQCGEMAPKFPSLQFIATAAQMNGETLAQAQSAGAFGIALPADRLTEEGLSMAHVAGLCTMAQECQDEEILKTLIARGVNVVVSSQIDLALPYMPEKEEIEAEI